MNVIYMALIKYSIYSLFSIIAELTVQPNPAEGRSNLIWFNSTNYISWATQLDNFMEGILSK